MKWLFLQTSPLMTVVWVYWYQCSMVVTTVLRLCEGPWDAPSHGGFCSPSTSPYPKQKPEGSRPQGPDTKLTTHKTLPAPALLSLWAFENLGKIWAPTRLIFSVLTLSLSLRLAVFLNQVWVTRNGLPPVLRVALFLFPWIRELRAPPRQLFSSPLPKPSLRPD